MNVQQPERISQILPTVKCSSCGVTVEYRQLGSHLCQGAPEVPALPAAFRNITSPGGLNPDVPTLPPSMKKFNNNNNNTRQIPNPILASGQNSYNNYGQPPRTPSSPISPYEKSMNSAYPSFPANYNNPPETTRSGGGSGGNSFMKKYNKLAGKPTDPSTNQYIDSPVEAQYPDNRNDYYGNKFSAPRAAPYPPSSNGYENNQGNTYNNKPPTQQHNPRGAYAPDRSRDVYGMDKMRDQSRHDQYRNNSNMAPGTRYDSTKDWVRERNDKSRSPGNYERAEYDRRYKQSNQSNPNQQYTNTDYEQPRQPSYDRQNNYPSYGYDNNARAPAVRKPSYDTGSIIQPGSYLPPAPPSEHNRTPSSSGSFSSMDSAQSAQGRQLSVDTNTPSTRNTGNTGGFDSVMNDLMKEMDSLSTSPNSDHDNHSAFHSRNASATSDVCAYCKGPILSNSLKALNRLWHPEHLLCARCNKPIDPDIGHVEKNGKVYCLHDFKEMFLPKCRGCNRPVEKAVSASDGKLEGKWHVNCFCCQTCRKPFPDKSFYVFNNAPYCQRHYHKLNNSLCKNCDEPIEGPCAQTLEEWRYHPSCFTCFTCRIPLTDIYYDFENHQYCETHIMEIQQRRKIRAEKRQTIFHIL